MKQSITLILLFALVTFSCKKDDKPGQTTTQRIQHKWSVDSYVTNNHTGGIDDIETSPGSTQDYVDFRSDGKVYFQFAGEADTLAYSVQGDNSVTIESFGTYTIKTLNDNLLILYYKDAEANGDFYEETLNLKR